MVFNKVVYSVRVLYGGESGRVWRGERESMEGSALDVVL